MSHDFWMLLGSITVTSAAFAMIGLTIYHARAKEAYDELRGHGFGEPVASVTFSKLANNLLFFLIPLTLSLTAVAPNKATWCLMPVLLISSFFTYFRMRRYGRGKDGWINIHLAGIIGVAASIVSSILSWLLWISGTDDPAGVEKWLIICALASLFLGFFFSMVTIRYLEHSKAFFLVTEKVIERLNSRVTAIDDVWLSYLSRYDGDDEYKKRLEERRRSIHAMKGRTNEVLSYREITNMLDILESVWGSLKKTSLILEDLIDDKEQR
jgi:hypothetical protein